MGGSRAEARGGEIARNREPAGLHFPWLTTPRTFRNSLVRVKFAYPTDGRCPASLALRHIRLSLHPATLLSLRNSPFLPQLSLHPASAWTHPPRSTSDSRFTDAADSRSPTLSRSSESHAGLPKRLRQPATRTAVPVQTSGPAQSPVAHPGLDRFNAAPAAEAEAALLECSGSRRWAARLAAHRPYPDLDALLAAADEAGYDLPPADLAEALAAEVSPDCITPRRTPPISRCGPRTPRTSAASAMSS